MTISRVCYGLGAVILATMLAACAAHDGHRSTGQYTDDTATTARVKAALVQADRVSATDVQVETYNGVVQLSGFVPDQDAANQAVIAARNVDGVKEVRNVDGVKEVRNDIQVRAPR